MFVGELADSKLVKGAIALPIFYFDFLSCVVYIGDVDTLTIPKKLTQKGELVVIPREEYEVFSEWKKALRIRVVKPTKSELAAIRRGRREIKGGKYVEWKKFKQELARRTR